jgi:hypothetical protein
MPVNKADLNGARREYHRVKTARLRRKARLERTGSAEPMSTHERAKLAANALWAKRKKAKEGTA